MTDNPEQKQVLSVQEAWGELQKSLMQMSPQEAHRNFQMAQDEIKRLQQEEKERRQQEEKKRQQPTKVPTTEKKVEDTVTAIKDMKKQSICTAFSLSRNDESDAECKTQATSSCNHERNWIYSVDEMPNISSYQVTLWPKTKTEILLSPHDLELSMKCSSQGNTVVTLRLQDALLFSAQFPGRLVSSPELLANAVQRQRDCLTVRLQSRDTFHDDVCTSHNPTSLAAVHSICCRYCDHALLATTQQIEKVLPLPKGHWDEVTDYLICYNGQPAVDFSSASTLAQEHLALEDSAVLVIHSNNIGNATCVLGVEGYGEESAGGEVDDDEGTDSATFRGPRAWRDAVGGATLCCSQCCAVLGFASLTSPETFRLLKHRLSTRGDNLQWNSLHGCAAFVAHEVVRYAESKAIYTFVVSVRSEGIPDQHRKCILLKLLSWDTRQANSKDSTSVDDVDLLSFKRVVRVIYEVSADQDIGTVHDSDDPMNWTWGGVDLCCLPDGTRVQQAQMGTGKQAEQQRTASVRLWLSQEEWNELHHALVESSKYFSKAVTDATILVKLGPQTEKRVDGSIGLSALPLLM